VLSAGLTVVFVAPTTGRIRLVRRAHMIMVHYLFLQSMDNREWVIGMNIRGWLLHLTVHKMLRYGYVTPHEFEKAVSLAVVRNPYRRMVSIYLYNRFGALETFSKFVESWQNTALHHYRESGILDEWNTPCHAIPQFEYTHFEGVQLVQSIVKHEELEDLVTVPYTTDDDDVSQPLSELPAVVRAAFVGMPRVNQRNTERHWTSYYDQKTLDQTHELYKMDFAVFGYPTTIDERPDLKPPRDVVSENDLRSFGVESFSRNTAAAGMGSEQRKRRRTLLSRAASLSAERSSMVEIRRLFPGTSTDGSKKRD